MGSSRPMSQPVTAAISQGRHATFFRRGRRLTFSKHVIIGRQLMSTDEAKVTQALRCAAFHRDLLQKPIPD